MSSLMQLEQENYEYMAKTNQLITKLMTDLIINKPNEQIDYIIDWMRKEKLGENKQNQFNVLNQKNNEFYKTQNFKKKESSFTLKNSKIDKNIKQQNQNITKNKDSIKIKMQTSQQINQENNDLVQQNNQQSSLQIDNKENIIQNQVQINKQEPIILNNQINQSQDFGFSTQIDVQPKQKQVENNENQNNENNIQQ